MKLTKSILKKIIKEELEKLNETTYKLNLDNIKVTMDENKVTIGKETISRKEFKRIMQFVIKNGLSYK